MPSATGKSMLIERWRKSRNALAKNGRQEKSTTGSESTHCAQRKRLTRSGAISPGAAKYVGAAYIITCIMQTPATPRRQSILRVSAWRRALAKASWAGSGR